MRLDGFVSKAAGVSRSQARTWIRRGEVRVDGQPVREAGYRLDADTRVSVGSEELSLPGGLYLMLHKPRGLLSATRDAHQQTVLSLLPDALAARVHLAGRLDKDTSGLLLLTDDGDWSHRITAPHSRCPKVYLADLAEPLTGDAESRLGQGLLLRSEQRPTRPAHLQRLEANRVRITIDEGRYHQVRRMFAALGNRVVALHRESIGGLSLDPSLDPGQWRPLSVRECDAVLPVTHSNARESD